MTMSSSDCVCAPSTVDNGVADISLLFSHESYFFRSVISLRARRDLDKN